MSRMYADERSLQERRAESLRVLKKYPDRVPCIIEPGSTKAPPITRRKYLVPRDMPFSHFHVFLRQQIKIQSHKAIFILVRGSVLPKATATAGQIYDDMKNPEDDLLMLVYDLETTFG